MPETPKINIDSQGMVTDDRTGLLIPHHVATAPGRRHANQDVPNFLRGLLEQKGYYDQQLLMGFYQQGVGLNRDEQTLVTRWERKGSDKSEMTLAAMASGEISNVGISPVPYPQLPALIRRQQVQAQTIDIDLVGRESPVTKARDAIARFNDSPMGVTKAISDMVFNLRVYNRGCPVAFAPITYDMEQWQGEGLEAVPIVLPGDSESKATTYYLQVDWSKRKTPVPYITDPLRFRYTGNDEWPYWFLAQHGRRHKWILLHSSHVIPVVPGNSARPRDMIGTSSVWVCLGFLAEEFMVIEERVEKKLAAVTNGILGISGISQTSAKIKEEMDAQVEMRKMEGKFFASEYTILTSENSRVNFAFLPLRQSDGIDYQARREHYEDILAASFQEPLQAVVLRGGIGYSSQSREAGEQNSDTGVTAILSLVEITLGAMFPRVQVTISRPNDPSQRLNIGAFNEFASAVQSINNSTGGDEPVLTRAEVRAIIDRDMFTIPEVDDDGAAQAGATADDTDQVETGDDSSDNNDDRENSELAALSDDIDTFLTDVVNFDKEIGYVHPA